MHAGLDTSCSIVSFSVDVAWSLQNHPHYHQPSDDPQYIDMDGLRSAAQIAVAALWLLVNDGREWGRRLDARLEVPNATNAPSFGRRDRSVYNRAARGAYPLTGAAGGTRNADLPV